MTDDTSYAWQDGWEQAWQPLVDVIGQDFSEGEKQPAVDDVEKATIRRYLEPLEFGCPLHFDEEAARQHGYRGILAPYSGISQTWTDQGQWSAGDPTNYPSADPNWNSVRRAAATAGRSRAHATHDRRLRDRHRDRVLRAGLRRRPSHVQRTQAAVRPPSGDQRGAWGVSNLGA